MNLIENLCPKTVSPIPKCSVQNETYFQFFTFIFLIIELISFSTSFYSLISSSKQIYVIVLLSKLGLLTGLFKILVDYIKSDNYGTIFAHYYSLFRVAVITSTILILLIRSAIWGLLATVFFTHHKHKRHYFSSTPIALSLFLGASVFCIYLNCLYALVIYRKKSEIVDNDKSDKAHLSEVNSQVTEP